LFPSCNECTVKHLFIYLQFVVFFLSTEHRQSPLAYFVYNGHSIRFIDFIEHQNWKILWETNKLTVVQLVAVRCVHDVLHTLLLLLLWFAIMKKSLPTFNLTLLIQVMLNSLKLLKITKHRLKLRAKTVWKNR